ncbi:MAG: right-handed parallel beta-helix repeat-containing protein [Rhodobacteraceae bacterium]|nr:right-handed parallel beta-helix repeat-containing protein [Paracoccaceae bacterium]
MTESILEADLAFAGAEGFGSEADGGRGGEIVKVTTLADSGPGSLRWALEELDGPRIVVFEVSGQIELKDSIAVNGDVTVAGQTSPDGITVTGAKLRILESDVIIRGMQFRPGDGDGDTPDNRDGISIGNKNQTVENVVLDGNSFSWSIDELVTVWYGSQNITISNNIMSEALQGSLHSKGDHSMALLVGDGSSNVTISGNLIAHNEFRNATVKDDSQQIEFINNVIYNYGPNGFLGHEGTTAHIIGNVYIAGEDSAGRAAIQLKSPEDGTAYYLHDNVAEVAGAATSKITDSYVFEPSNVTVLPSSEVVDSVLENAGARYPALTATDARIIQSVIDGTGSIIDSPDDVGGYDPVDNTKAPSDRDDDGIPDAHEVLFGTNPDVFDAHGDADGNGVSNIEDYINGLIDGFGQPSDPDGPVITPPVDPEPEDPLLPTDPPVNDGPVIRLEGEDFGSLSGFSVSSNGSASGDALIGVKAGNSGEASTVFAGESGIYNLDIGYFDEADGVSNLSVFINGNMVDSWDWDQELGSNFANGNTHTERAIEGVQINAGDTITFSGTSGGKEQLRVDYFDFQLQGSGDPGEGDPTPEPDPDQLSYKIEAESMVLESGWKVRDNSSASGGELIKASKNGQAKASTVFEGETGNHDIAIDYFDEADGASFLEVLVGGVVVDSWTWDQETEQDLAAPDSLVRHVIQDVHITAGESIVLQGYSDGGEPLRIDSIEIFADALFA